MPGKGLLSSLADKAQAAIATTPLAGKVSVPGATDPAASAAGANSGAGGATAAAAAAGAGAYGGRPSSEVGHGQPHYTAPAQEQSGTLGGRHYGLEAIHHQLRSWQVQHSYVHLVHTPHTPHLSIMVLRAYIIHYHYHLDLAHRKRIVNCNC